MSKAKLAAAASLTKHNGGFIKTWRSVVPNVDFAQLQAVQKGFSPFRKVSHLISKERCEEILDSIDLSAYKNCVLIDMNPGPGILSAALQERIQPRRHILLEPNAGFHPMLQKTVLDRRLSPTTTTILTGFNGYSWKTIERLTASKVLQAKTIPHSEGVNTDVLFVGDMTMGETGDRFANQIIQSVYSRNWLQKLGRVKMLCCLHDLARNRLAPPEVYWRSKVSVMSELCADLRVVASTPLSGRTKEYLEAWEEAEAKLTIPKKPVNASNRQIGLRAVEIYKYIEKPKKRKAIKDDEPGQAVTTNLFVELAKHEESEELDDRELDVVYETEKYSVADRFGHTFETVYQKHKDTMVSIDIESEVYPDNNGFSFVDITPKELDPWFFPDDPTEAHVRFDVFSWLMTLLFTRRTGNLRMGLMKICNAGECSLNYLEPGHIVQPDLAVNQQHPEAFVQLTKALMKWPFFDRSIIYQESTSSTEDREETHRWETAIAEADMAVGAEVKE